MNEIFELLPIPEARDFPAERFEARRAALVAAIRRDAANEPLARRVIRLVSKTWLTLAGILAVSIAPVVLSLSAQQRFVQRDAVAVLAAAGTAQIMVAVAPQVGRAGSFSASAGQRFTCPPWRR
jgi:hypothetical protein